MHVGMPVCFRRNNASFAAVVIAVTSRAPEHPRADVSFFNVETRTWDVVHDVGYLTSNELPESGPADKPTLCFHEVGGPYDRSLREPVSLSDEAALREERDRPADREYATDTSRSAGSPAPGSLAAEGARDLAAPEAAAQEA